MFSVMVSIFSKSLGIQKGPKEGALLLAHKVAKPHPKVTKISMNFNPNNHFKQNFAIKLSLCYLNNFNTATQNDEVSRLILDFKKLIGSKILCLAL
jgi:hypothetical protein